MFLLSGLAAYLQRRLIAMPAGQATALVGRVGEKSAPNPPPVAVRRPQGCSFWGSIIQEVICVILFGPLIPFVDTSTPPTQFDV